MALALIAIGLAIWWGSGFQFGVAFIVGLTLLLLGGAWLFLAATSLRRPRLAYDAGVLHLYLGLGRPAKVPIEIVECFFLGSAASGLPGALGKARRASTVVVRLAESAREWADREVDERLGQWNDGYIVIRGAWCEPLTRSRLEQLNRKLLEERRRLKVETA